MLRMFILTGKPTQLEPETEVKFIMILALIICNIVVKLWCGYRGLACVRYLVDLIWFYNQRLKLITSLKWSKLEDRCLRGDMIEVFELLNDFDVAAPNTFFHRSFTGLRGHKFELCKSCFCTNVSKFLFSNRIIQDWSKFTLYRVTLSTLSKQERSASFALSALSG